MHTPLNLIDTLLTCKFKFSYQFYRNVQREFFMYVCVFNVYLTNMLRNLSILPLYRCYVLT